MVLHAGGLKDRLRIEKRVITRVSTGEVETWEHVATKWARVIPIEIVPIRFRSDFVQFDQNLARATYKVYMRGFVKLDMANYRLVWNTIGWDNMGEIKYLVPMRQEIMRGGPSMNFTAVFTREDPDMKQEPLGVS